MLTLLFGMFMVGYGAGYEGESNGKYYFGVYTPTHEYGWVVSDSEIYLDTVLEKRR